MIDVEYWDGQGRQTAARRSFEVDVVGAGQEESDLEHISPSIFGRMGEGHAEAVGELI